MTTPTHTVEAAKRLFDDSIRAAGRDRFIVKTGDAIGEVGLYIEGVREADGKHSERLFRFFLARNMLTTYDRNTDKTRTVWRAKTFSDHAAARDALRARIIRQNIKIIGHPLVVMLDENDIEAIAAKKSPPARYRGQATHERFFGAYTGGTVDVQVTDGVLLAGARMKMRTVQSRARVLDNRDRQDAGLEPLDEIVDARETLAKEATASIDSGPVGDEPY